MRLKDIAEKAGVSTATVSNVINKNFNKVSTETIELVEKIIKENNYSPNAMAKGLASKESKIIGVVVPNVQDWETFSRSPYNTKIISYLEKQIRQQGYNMLLRSVLYSDEVLGYFDTWNVDGIIFFGTLKDKVIKIKERIKVPSMYIDTYGDDIEIANVGSNDFLAEYNMTKYMLEKGHRNIIFVGPSIDYPGVIQERYKGFCVALKEYGINVTERNHIETVTSYDDGENIGIRIANDYSDFTAAVCTADILAVGIIQGMRKCGRDVPRDFSVAGFDDLDFCEYTHPKLTSINQLIEEKASIAASSIIEMAKNKEQLIFNKILDTKIMERSSVKDIN